MKDNKVDKAFKEGLKGGKMPYSESYWAAMETMLPATAPTPATKATTAIGYKLAAWFAGIALVGTAGYFWLSGSETEVDLPAETKQVQEVEGQVAQPAVENMDGSELPEAEIAQEPSAPQVEDRDVNNANTTNAVIKNEKATSVATLNVNESKVSTTNAGNGRTVANQPSQKPQASLIEDKAEVVQTTKTDENVMVEQDNGADVLVLQKSQNANTNVTVKTPASAQNENALAEENADEQSLVNSEAPSAPEEVTPQLPEAASASAPEAAAAPIILPHQKGKNLLWSAGVDYQYLLLNRSLSTTNPSLTDYVDFRTANENPTYQSGLGINVQLEANQWLFNSGIYSITYHEEINYPSTLLVNVGVDNGQWNINNNYSYTTDSSWVIDSVYAGHWQIDTTWSLTQDSVWVSAWDTVATEKEAPELAANNGVFALSYIEIPLWFGRSFGQNKLHFDVQAGIGLGILSGTKGSVYINQNVDGLVTTDYQMEQFSNINLSGLLRAGIRYEFTEQLQVLFYPTLRYTFTSVFQDAAIRQRYLGYGLTVGVVYRF